MPWARSWSSASSCVDGPERPAGGEAGEQLLLAHGPDAARDALAARLVAEERGDAAEGVGEVGGLVEGEDDARAKGRPDRRGSPRTSAAGRARPGRRRRPPRRRGGSPGGRGRPARRPRARAARRRVAPNGDLVHARPRDVAGHAEELRAGRAPPVPIAANASAPIAQDQRHVGERLDVVDRGRLAEQARPRPGTAACCAARRGRPRSSRTAPSPRRRCRRRRRGGARCRSAKPGRGCRRRGARRPGRAIASASRSRRQRVLAAEVEVAALGAGGVARRSSSPRRSRTGPPRCSTRSLNVPGLGLVGVADEVVRLRRLRRDGCPLAAGREGGAAAADEPRCGDLVDHAPRGPIARAVASAS